MEKKTAQDKGATIVCVHCGNTARSVYVEYSPGNIRLSTCAHCQSPVDEYVEYETLVHHRLVLVYCVSGYETVSISYFRSALLMVANVSTIVIIDAILHKPEAYRHLFFNYPELHHFNLLVKNLIWKATLVDLLLDTCRRSLQGVGKKDAIQWDSLTSFISTAGKVVAQTTCLNFAFLLVLSLAAREWPGRGSSANVKSRHILLAVLLSSHFKLVVFAMLVWEFSPLMNLMIDMLVFSSNTVALKVMLKTTTAHAAVAVMSGAAAKTIVGTLLGISGLDLFHGGNFYNR